MSDSLMPTHRVRRFVWAVPLALAAVTALAQSAEQSVDSSATESAPATLTPLAQPAAAPGSAEVVPLEDLSRATTQPVLLAVRINEQPVGDAALLRQQDGSLLARRSDWTRWRLNLPPQPPRAISGEDWWALALAPGYTLKLDEATQQADFGFAPRAFNASQLTSNPSRRYSPQRPESLGGYLNYEVVGSSERGSQQATRDAVNGFFETVLFNRFGSASSQFLARDMTGSMGSSVPDGEVIRLDTTLRRDEPEDMFTYTAGDTIGKSGLWGRAVRFGGASAMRNFSTQPGFLSVPQPALSGETSLPSVLELYVDGVLRNRQNIPTGPFSVDEIPAINGQGQIEVVVRDLLGREQLLALPYINGSQLLRQGLHDYSVEAGWLRESFGIKSDDYGRFTSATQHQYGFTDRFTGEARFEVRGGGDATLGTGGVVAVPVVGLVSGAVVGSVEEGDTGALAVLGLQRSVARGLSFGTFGQWATRDFVQNGSIEGSAPPVRLVSASIGLPLFSRASTAISYVMQANRDGQDVSQVGVTFSTRLLGGSLSAQASQRIEPSRSQSVGVFYSRALGRRMSAGVTLRQSRPEDGETSTLAGLNVQQSLPEGEGYGWRAAAFTREGPGIEGERVELAGAVNGNMGSAAMEVNSESGSEALRATVSGAVVAFGGSVLPTRRINTGFALVQAGAPDVPLSLNGSISAHTNASGMALLPNVMAYQDNRVFADITELPMDVSGPTGETSVIPMHKSGLVVPLGIRVMRAALVMLMGVDGQFLPAGSEVRIVGGRETYPVARDGLAYITGLAAGETRIEVVPPAVAGLDTGPRCTWRLALPANAGPEASLQPIGPLACEESTP